MLLPKITQKNTPFINNTPIQNLTIKDMFFFLLLCNGRWEDGVCVWGGCLLTLGLARQKIIGTQKKNNTKKNNTSLEFPKPITCTHQNGQVVSYVEWQWAVAIHEEIVGPYEVSKVGRVVSTGLNEVGQPAAVHECLLVH